MDQRKEGRKCCGVLAGTRNSIRQRRYTDEHPVYSVRSWCDGSSDQSFMVDSLNYFLSQPVSTTGVTKAVVCVILYVG